MSTVMRAVVAEPVGDVEHRAAIHRHTSREHEHEFEAQPGLPERLPAGERVLWQGAPDFRTLARECFHVRKLALYFALLVAWRLISAARSGASIGDIAIAGAIAIGLASTALGLTTLLAWMSARTSLYTITNRRVVMRVGIVLSVTFNLPFRKVESAGLRPLARGYGDIALALAPGNRIAFLHLWPHVRPWHVKRTEPNLRCVADARATADLLTAAWRAEHGDDAVATAPAAHAKDAGTKAAAGLRIVTPVSTPSLAIDVAQAA